MAKLIGLDIGSSTIKLVELEHTQKMHRLVAQGVAATPPKGLLSEATFDQLTLSEAVRKLAVDSKVTTRNVNVALPESSVFTRSIEMPVLSEKELSSAIRWEAEQYIPLPLAEAVLDYQITRKDIVTKTGPGMEVFLVAAPKTLIAKYEKVVKGAGLDLVSIETETLALARALVETSAESPVTMVLSIGADKTNVFVAKGTGVILTYVIAVGGKAFTRALASDLQIDLAQAEEYKKTYGLNKDVLSGKVRSTVKPVLDNLVVEIKRAVSFYQEKHGDSDSIRRFILVGGSAKLPGLVTYLAEAIGIETQLGDPWQMVTDTQKLSAQSFDPILFSEAVGLALKQISP